ncbi:hypothetical protein Tco_0204897 [Tanacetum coccineum]
MGRDTIQLEDVVSTISQEYLLEFASEYYIPKNLHPELPGPGDHIVDFPEGKVGVYTKKIEFANFRIPISQFLFDILRYYQIHLSQLSVIGVAKVSHFEINCRVLNIIPTVNLFLVFYVSSYNSGWISFSKRPAKKYPTMYTKPLDSLKNWNNRFFWVDEKVFPTVVAWRMAATKDDKPKVATLDTHPLHIFGDTLHRREVPLDFSNEDAPLPVAQGAEVGVHRTTAAELEIPVIDDAEATERDAGKGGSNAPAKVLRKDHDVARAEHNARRGKSLADMSVDTKPAIHGQETPEPPVATQSVSDPDPLSYAKPQPNPKQDVVYYANNIVSLFGGCRTSKEAGGAGNQDSENFLPSPSITRSP